ncbi:MAG: hypothetical protein IPO08_23350 [Xanthomonadales bacterium]|nr:hypothetical protein [Xanthomonadales bacterium]
MGSIENLSSVTSIPVHGQHGQPGACSAFMSEEARSRYEKFRIASKSAEIEMDMKDQLASWQRRAEMLSGTSDDTVFQFLDEVFDGEDSQCLERWGMQLALAVLSGDSESETKALARLINTAAEQQAKRKAEARYAARRD